MSPNDKSEESSTNTSTNNIDARMALGAQATVELPDERIEEITSQNKQDAISSDWARNKGQSDFILGGRRIRPGEMKTIRFSLLKTKLSDPWKIPVTVLHGPRPGPVVSVTGTMHGDELIGALAASHLLASSMTDSDGLLDPSKIAGTVVVAPILNLPGYQTGERYFPDGRDLNREFPGSEQGNTTQRVAHRLWKRMLSKSDYIIDIHCGTRGRYNHPHIRANLNHQPSRLLSRLSGSEIVLDSRSPARSLRRFANDSGIGAIVYEGGAADRLDHDAVEAAYEFLLNILRGLHVIYGNPSRPKFQLFASGSVWIRSDEGGLLDLLAKPGMMVRKDEVVAQINDPNQPQGVASVTAPSDGVMIATTTRPFIEPGGPLGHLIPLTSHQPELIASLGEDGCLNPLKDKAEPKWRESCEDIIIAGNWMSDHVDGGWMEGEAACGEEE